MVDIRLAESGDGKAVADFMNKGILSGEWRYIGRVDEWDSKKIKSSDEYYGSKSKGFCFLAFEEERVVGLVNFSFKKKGRLRHRVEFAWFVSRDFSGKGIGGKILSEALVFAKEKGFIKAEAEVCVENLASVKLAEKFGFEIEGTKKKAMVLDDESFCDTYLMGKVL